MKIAYLSLSERRCTIQFYGCNFKCKACFALNNTNRYTEVTPERLIAEIKQFDPGEVMLAGGEPTLYRKELIEFIKMYDRKTILTTNGSLLDGAFIREMENTCLKEIHIDLKAYTTKLHKWYTGSSNQMVFDAITQLDKSDLNFEVMTVFIPGIIDTEEIEKIAVFLASIGTKIKYKIIRYVPIGNISRRPTEAEINDAVTIAKEYLSNVTSSLEKRTHPLKSVRVRI